MSPRLSPALDVFRTQHDSLFLGDYNTQHPSWYSSSSSSRGEEGKPISTSPSQMRDSLSLMTTLPPDFIQMGLRWTSFLLQCGRGHLGHLWKFPGNGSRWSYHAYQLKHLGPKRPLPQTPLQSVLETRRHSSSLEDSSNNTTSQTWQARRSGPKVYRPKVYRTPMPSCLGLRAPNSPGTQFTAAKHLSTRLQTCPLHHYCPLTTGSQIARGSTRNNPDPHCDCVHRFF